MSSAGTGLKQKRFKKKTHSRSTAKNGNYAIVRVMTLSNIVDFESKYIP